MPYRIAPVEWRMESGPRCLPDSGRASRCGPSRHCTFRINSLCHYIGAQPYSSKCSARDSSLLAILTFGEGYHNYHHEFQYDYRNGVKLWQIDPTKWIIWIMSKIGLVSKLRRVSAEKIVLAELAEAQRRLAATLANPGLTEPTATYTSTAYHGLRETAQQWTQRKAGQLEVTREMLTTLRNEIRVVTNALRLPGLHRRQPG
jgi:stearoyl-CoA desaturase (Delta-9 desaturase)